MILRFNAIDLNGRPQGLAFNTKNKKFSHNREIWGIEGIPISMINLAKMNNKVEMDNYLYTDNAEEFYKEKEK